MKTPGTPVSPEEQAAILARLRRDREIRQNGYRERALRLFPHICASCQREFSGKKLRDLTVHHKDHNHDNNPPDGSNWELLCIYCHDHEHEKYKLTGQVDGYTQTETAEPSRIASPFQNLDDLFKPGRTDHGTEPKKNEP